MIFFVFMRWGKGYHSRKIGNLYDDQPKMFPSEAWYSKLFMMDNWASVYFLQHSWLISHEFALADQTWTTKESCSANCLSLFNRPGVGEGTGSEVQSWTNGTYSAMQWFTALMLAAVFCRVKSSQGGLCNQFSLKQLKIIT